MFKCTNGFIWTHSSLFSLPQKPSEMSWKQCRCTIKQVQKVALLLNQVHVVLKCLLSSYALMHRDPLQHSPNNRIVCLNKLTTAVSIFQSNLQACRLWWQVLLMAGTWHSFRGDRAPKFNLGHFLIGLEGCLWMSE